MSASIHSRHRPEGTDVEVVSFATLPRLVSDPVDDAFLVVLDPGGPPPELPLERPLTLRLRFHAPEERFRAPNASLRPFEPRHAEQVLRFLDRVRPGCSRLVVCSPAAEVRGPGLALGLADLMRWPRARIEALELEYRRTYSRGVRRTLWQTAHPPKPGPTGPVERAATEVLYFLTKHLSN